MADEIVAAAETPAADTSATDLTGGAGQEQTPEIGQGDAPQGDGQGADNGNGAEGAASADADAPGGEEGADAPGAPEQYADFTLPDGYDLTGPMLEGVQTFAKAHNLNQAQAQALVDLGVQQAAAITEQFAAEAMATPVPMANHHAVEWSKQTAADPVLGGDNLKGTMALAQRVFETFATPALGEFLTKNGLAHHPELIRFMTEVGKKVSEDTLVTPRGDRQQARPGQNSASKLYPNMN